MQLPTARASCCLPTHRFTYGGAPAILIPASPPFDTRLIESDDNPLNHRRLYSFELADLRTNAVDSEPRCVENPPRGAEKDHAVISANEDRGVDGRSGGDRGGESKGENRCYPALGALA